MNASIAVDTDSGQLCCKVGRGSHYALHPLESFMQVTDGLGDPDRTPPEIVRFMLSRPSPNLAQFDWDRVTDACREMADAIQRDGIREMIHSHDGRSYLAYDPGVGKTLTSTLFMIHYGGPMLAVVPSNKVADFAHDILKYIGRRVVVIKTKKDIVPDTDDVFVVCSYTMVRDNPGVSAKKWRTVVVDEAHALKGNSQLTRVMTPMIHQARAALLMSGTPQLACPEELFRPFHMLYPEVFPSWERFVTRYCGGKVNKYGKWEARGTKNAEELELVKRKFMIRVRKENVTTFTLPPLTRTMLRFTLKDTEEIAEFEKLHTRLQELREWKKKAKSEREEMRVEGIQKTVGGELHRLSGMCKARLGAPWIVKYMKDHPDEKVSIFACYIPVVDYICAALKEAGIRYARVAGGISNDARDKTLKKVSDPNDKTYQAVVGTIQKFGVGANLEPGCTTIFLIEMHHSYMKQGECRAYRRNAVHHVRTFWFYADGTRDAYTLAQLQKKSHSNGQTIDGLPDDEIVFHETVDVLL
jgi:SWI/SNF-related matrix-associated actin-dependent regulator of chromatin subfamily A-like protein 1